MARKAGKAKVISEQEFDRVVKLQQVNSRTGKRNLLLLHLSFYLGLRVKEIAGLKFGDVFEQNGNIKQEATLTITKGEKIRQTYLTNPKLITLLKQHYNRHVQAGNLFQMEQPLLVSERGCKFSPNSLQQLFSRLYKQAGIHGASSHSGRRSFATSLISSGIDIRSVQHLLGHSCINTTARYIQENPAMLQRIMASLKPCGIYKYFEEI